jgi:4-alpha-glucanotransferase
MSYPEGFTKKSSESAKTMSETVAPIWRDKSKLMTESQRSTREWLAHHGNWWMLKAGQATEHWENLDKLSAQGVPGIKTHIDKLKKELEEFDSFGKPVSSTGGSEQT